MIRYLWHNRLRPPAFSPAWVKGWLKRALNLRGLMVFACRSWMLRRQGAQIAETAICSKLTIHGDVSHLSIGDHCSIGEIYLQSLAPIRIGNNVVINNEARLITGSHDVNDPYYKHVFKEIVVEDYVWIAMNAIVLQGVRIGRGAVVAAGAVVSRDVAPFSIVAGNPARPISERKTREFLYHPSRWYAPMEAWLGPEESTVVKD